MVEEKSEEKTAMLPRSRFKFSWSVPIISLMLLAYAPANAQEQLSEPKLLLGGVLPNSVAVLPFENLSPDLDNAHFAAGILESTLNQLTKIRDLIVIARTSVMPYQKQPPTVPEIAKTLNVEAVMEGSVRYANGRVLISVQLVDGQTGTHLWSDEFNRELTDVSAIQAEIASHIATAMQVQLSPDEQARIADRPTQSSVALKHYLYALSLPDPVLYPEYLPAYIDSLEQAVAVDPKFSEAYADLAWGYYTRRERDIALEYAEKAVALNPTSGSAFSLLAVSLEQYQVHEEETRTAYERAVQLSPNDPEVLIEYGSFLVEQIGNDPEAIRIGKLTVAIDPRNASFHGRLGYIFLNAGDLQGAAAHLREAIRLDPGVYTNYFELATVGFLSGNNCSARENLNRAAQVMESGATFRVGYIAYLYGLLGEPHQAEKLLAQYEESLGDPERENWRPLGWAILGTRDKERALLEWTMTVDGYLQENQPVSRGRMSRFRDNWLNDPMLEQADFLELRKRVGFTE